MLELSASTVMTDVSYHNIVSVVTWYCHEKSNVNVVAPILSCDANFNVE